MNNEEILKYINEQIDKCYVIEHKDFEKVDLSNLLDYITNLQEENEKYKRIFEGKERFSKIMPDDTDFIILSKADYDRQQEDIELGLIDYKSRIDKANQILQEILVVSDWEHEGKYRAVKNTTTQDVYKTIVLLNEILETPHRRNYGLLHGEDKE